MKLNLGSIGDLFQGVGQLISGVKAVKDGLGDLGLFESPQPFKAPGEDPQIKVYNVGASIGERISKIREQAQKGMRNPKIREYAVRLISAKCATCPKCKTVNVFTEVLDYPFKPNQVVAKIDETRWNCGKCGSSQPISATVWCTQEKNWKQESVIIFDAVRSQVRYARDIAGVDTYQNPARTLEWKGGDCDCYTILLAGLLGSIGHTTQMEVIETKAPISPYSFETKRAGTWNHILLLDGMPPRAPKSWLPLDASINQPAGWYPPPEMIYKVKRFKV